jgi:threonine/homoserine/homoserine lactone efflux protein
MSMALCVQRRAMLYQVMSVDLFLALVVFAFVMSVTPGPNNVMLLASGVNYGFRRSIPHMLGITIGFSFMIVVVGIGLGQVFERFPMTYDIMRYGGGAYMLWLAWRIANSGPVGEGKTAGSPMTLLQAALFQWVNPKAWVITISAIATYTPGNGSLWPVLLVALVCGVVNFPTIGMWAMFGTLLRNLLTQPTFLRIFNISMAVLLVLSLAPLVWH